MARSRAEFWKFLRYVARWSLLWHLRRYFMVIVVKNAFLTFQFFVALKILVFFRSSLIVLKANIVLARNEKNKINISTQKRALTISNFSFTPRNSFSPLLPLLICFVSPRLCSSIVENIRDWRISKRCNMLSTIIVREKNYSLQSSRRRDWSIRDVFNSFEIIKLNLSQIS